MITGFNTDVKHNAKVYHVQTEDKGRHNPKIETLVYVGGEILDNYRTSYEQSKAELSEDEIMELLESQHKRVIRTIKVGKYDTSAPFEEGLITDRSLDEVIIQYLEGEEVPDHLKLVTNGVVPLIRDRSGGLRIETSKTVSGEMVEGVQVRVKLVAPNYKTLTLARGSSDQEGKLAIRVKLPNVKVNDAALVIQAVSEWGVAEQKYPIR